MHLNNTKSPPHSYCKKKVTMCCNEKAGYLCVAMLKKINVLYIDCM
jgi:hypothetical protein